MTHGNLSRLERGIIPYNKPALEKIAGALRTDPGSLIIAPPERAEISQLLTEFPKAKLRQLLDIARILREDPDLDKSQPLGRPYPLLWPQDLDHAMLDFGGRGTDYECSWTWGQAAAIPHNVCVTVGKVVG